MNFIELIETSKNNRKRFEELVNYGKGRIIPMFGAGVSCAVGYPSWKKLLKDIVEKESEKANVKKLLDEGKYEDAASFAQKKVGKRTFFDYIKNTFSIENMKKLDSCYISELPDVFTGIMATTNYDKVIETSYINRKKAITTYLPMDEFQYEAIEEHLHEGTNCLLKLHGSVDVTDSIIFSKEHYDKYYGFDGIDTSLSMPKTLNQAIAGRAFLFLGCSLQGDRLLKLFENHNYATHFALLELPKKEDERIERERQLRNDYGIKVIWYPNNREDKYDAIAVLIRELKSRWFPQNLSDDTLINAHQERLKNSIQIQADTVNILTAKTEKVSDQNIDVKTHSIVKEESEKVNLKIEKKNNSLSNETLNYYKDIIKNELILPWIYGETTSFDVVFTRLFIKPIMKSKKRHVKYSSINSLIKKNKNKNIIISGDAGIGKSTLLKHIFLFNSDEKIDFLYIKAKEIYNYSENCNSELNNYIRYISNVINGCVPDKITVLLIDGIDEEFAEASKINDLYSLIKKICKQKKMYVWFGWRKEHLNKVRNNELNQVISDEIDIQEWNVKKARKYVKRYSEYCDCQYINQIFKESIKQYENILSFLQNPFQLTLLVYLLKNKTFKNATSISLFTLYSEFISLWIKKEAPYSDSDSLIKKLTSYAETIYSNESVALDDEKSVIRDLFHFREPNMAYEFCHSSIASFFIAKKKIDDLIAKSSIHFEPLMADVTVFIKSSESYYQKSKMTILNYLIQSYTDLENSTKSKEEVLRNKNGIIYLITRLSLDKKVQQQFIEKKKTLESDPRMKVSIAYGAASLGLQELTVEFAKEFYDSTSELEKATRSFSLVYYGDVHREDFFNYQDDGKVPWTKSREIRLKNLASNKNKEINFRILDIPLLYCFYRSRDWRNINFRDYIMIMSTRISSKNYCSVAYEFLKEKTNELKKIYLIYLLFHLK